MWLGREGVRIEIIRIAHTAEVSRYITGTSPPSLMTGIVKTIKDAGGDIVLGIGYIERVFRRQNPVRVLEGS